MTAFSVLQTDVRNFTLDLPAETDALVPDFIVKAIRDAEVRHNFRYMEAEVALVTTVDTRIVDTVPPLWKARLTDPYVLLDDGTTREFEWAPSASEMIRRYDNDTDDDGDPEFLFEDQTNFSVYPLPDGDSDYTDGEYRIYVPYYAFSAALSLDTDTNWMTNNMRWYVTYAAAGEACLMNRDSVTASNLLTRAETQFQLGVKQDKKSKATRRLTLAPRRAVYGPARGIRR